MNKINIWHENEPVITENANFTPYLTFHKAEKSINKTILICPGGAYIRTADDHEGEQVASFFNSFGVDAFILRYTTTERNNNVPVYPLPFLDATRSMRYIRANADKFNINPNCLGIMGFSAGGHLAAWVSTKWDDKPDIKEFEYLQNNYKKYGYSDNSYPDDLFGKYSARPDFSVLVYPVIDLYKYTEYNVTGLYLLGPDANIKDREALCNENNVSVNTPSTFIWHTVEDQSVPIINSVKYYEELIKHNIPGEIHTYQPGWHGMGLVKGLDYIKADNSKVYDYCKDWSERLKYWIINMI